MNLFVLHIDPHLAAVMLCDKHIVRMPLETAQLLCSVYWAALKSESSEDKVSVTDTDIKLSVPYKMTHVNHPVAKWTRESRANFEWAVEHGLAICKEFSHRYKKVHKSELVIDWCQQNKHVLQFSANELTDFFQAMPDQYRRADVVNAYRDYYINEKMRFAKWEKGREKPDWIAIS